MVADQTLSDLPKIEVEECVDVLDSLRVIALFADRYGDTFLHDVLSKGTPVTQPIIEKFMESDQQRKKREKKLRHQPSNAEFEYEIAWIAYSLSNAIDRHERNLAVLSLYDDDQRHYLAFILRPILDCFEPAGAVAKHLGVPPSSLSRWAAGKARPQKLVRETLKVRLIELTEATLKTLIDLSSVVGELMRLAQLDRKKLERKCAKELAAERAQIEKQFDCQKAIA